MAYTINDLTGDEQSLLGQNIKIEAIPQRLFYPKQEMSTLEAGSFGLLSVDVSEVKDGAIPECFNIGWGAGERFYNITVKGKLPRLMPDVHYSIIATLVSHPQYGLSYQIVEMNRTDEINTVDEEKEFIYYVFGNELASVFYAVFDNPFKLFIGNTDKAIEELSRIKGIKYKKAANLLEKFKKNAPNFKAIVYLQGKYGLSPLAVSSLVAQYKSVDTVIAKIEENPYVLTEVDGWGFARCDKVALAKGISVESPFRIEAFVRHDLNQIFDSEGHTWVLLDRLAQDIRTIAPNIENKKLSAYFQDWVYNHDWLYYDKQTKRIGLRKYYTLEYNIAEEFKRLLTAPVAMYDKQAFADVIKECEEENGWEYTEEQKVAIYGCMDNNVYLITAKAGCVDKDTEFFNGEKWKPISEYVDGDKVLQYNADGTANLVIPNNYIKLPCDNLWLTQTKYGVDMCLSDEHRVIYQTARGNMAEHTMLDFKKAHEKSGGGFGGKLYTSFIYEGEGIALTDAEIKIMCAVICDGSFFKNEKSKRCRFHIKKDRKKTRLREIFKEAGLDYKESISAAEGYTDFYIDAPVRTKTFTKEWYKCTQHQLQIICDNILFWDGTVTNGRARFCSNVKENADFVQFAFAACGYKATLDSRNRVGQEYFTCGKIYTRKSEEYNINITKRNMVSIGCFHADNPNKTKIIPYKPIDGFKYCFTVPSSMWVMRRNGKILITGNCGKTVSMKPIARYAKKMGLALGQVSLAGKAASNLSENTGEEGSTIHRFLGYRPEDGFLHDKDTPVRHDIIILDELSLVGLDIFYHLIQAIKDGAHLIMLGDHCQLESIGGAAILRDCLESNVVPNKILTKIHRQAQRSAIITESLKVSDGQQIVSNTPITEVRGELKDLKVVTYNSSEESQMKFIGEYKKLLEIGILPNDILGVVPMKSRGSLSCLNLNKEIQKIVNGDEEKPSIKVKSPDGEYELRLGDKIVNRKNHYDTESVDGEETPIYNGNVGYVTEVGDSYIVVNFTQWGKVIVPKDYILDVNLGYVLTAHSAQGSQSPYVIVGLDMSAYVLLSKEWEYTALTRARKYCVLCGQISAIRKATTISRVSKKQTFLKELLRKSIQQL